MSKLATNFNPELVDNLDVDAQYTEAMRQIELTHNQLAALPQNPDAPQMSLEQRFDNMGVERNQNDFSMFMASGLETMAMGALTAATGITGMTALAAEVGASMATQRLNDNGQKSDTKTTFKRAANVTANGKPKNNASLFMAPKPAGTFKRAPKQVMQTSFMKRAMLKHARQQQMRAYMAVRPQHTVLERTMKDLKNDIGQLNGLKRQKISTISQTEQGKVFNQYASPNQPRFVRQQDQRIDDTARRLAAVHGIKHATAARALRPQMMGMG